VHENKTNHVSSHASVGKQWESYLIVLQNW